MRYIFFIFLILFSVSLSTNFAGADERGKSHSHGGDGGAVPVVCTGSKTPGCLANPLDSSISSIPKFFEAIINILLVFAIPFVVFFIIYAGFLYVTARGNPEAIKKAHAALLYALIGGMLILGSRILLEIITNTVTQIK